MRNHGWELPYHPLQVAAVAVFVSLAFAFYVFFVPFVGNRILEFHVIAVYSPVVIAVFVLYIRCTASNPADPGVLGSKKYQGSSVAKTSGRASRAVEGNAATTHQQTAAGRLSPQQHETEKSHGSGKHHRCSSALARLPCAPYLKNLCTESASGRFISDDDLLYCSLCEVEIFKYSKHCRVCDKCVDGFDHHCRWLNNCIGRKNYRCFITLMISGISMLVLQWAVGIWVVVRCFLYRRLLVNDIVVRLGSSFSLVPFIVVVALCTVLAMIVTLPLGQLFCFHVLLIKKGISTYDYIVAMREQEQQLNNTFEANQSPVTSPASSVATAVSGASSVGGLSRGAWCTPPRPFLDHNQAVLQPDKAFSSGEFETGAATKALAEEHMKKKPAVKISPWALARLNTADALRAAAQARKNSSIIRPVTPKEGIVVAETDSSLDTSSRDVSAEIIPPTRSRMVTGKADVPLSPLRERFKLMKSWGHGKLPIESQQQTDGDSVVVNVDEPLKGGDVGFTPLQMEALRAFRPSRADYARVSSPASSLASSKSRSSRQCRQDASHIAAAAPTDWPCLQRSTSDGYEASGGESADDSDRSGRLVQVPWSKLMLYGNGGELKQFSGKRVTSLHEVRTSPVSSMPYRVSKPSNANGAAEEVGSRQDRPAILMQREKASLATSQVGSSERESDFFSAMESAPMSKRESEFFSAMDSAPMSTVTSRSVSIKSTISPGP